MTMQEYAARQTSALLERLAQQIARTSELPDDEAIHDLRVTIRRLSRCLRVFGAFYPGKSWKKLRRRLADLMDAAAAVRDLDIARELLVKAGLSPRSAAIMHLSRERANRSRALLAEVRRWQGREINQWNRKLELPSWTS